MSKFMKLAAVGGIAVIGGLAGAGVASAQTHYPYGSPQNPCRPIDQVRDWAEWTACYPQGYDTVI